METMDTTAAPKREMVRLTLCKGSALVWDVDDWKVLRQEHRIIGNLMGCVPQLPRQDIVNGMPMKLLPEEVTLIIEKKIGKIFRYADTFLQPSEEVKRKYEEYSERIKKEQIEYYEQKRKDEVRSMIDRIVEGKRRKLSNQEKPVTVDVEAIFKSEMEKTSESLAVGPLNVQIPTVHPWFKDNDLLPVDWTFPETPLDCLKYKVFRDLWEKGYYLTPGSKFGGHFLVYPGEPLKFHGFFIVYCYLNNENISLSTIITHSRLANLTRKTFVMASENEEGIVTYRSFEWRGMS